MRTKRIGPITLAWRSLVITILNIMGMGFSPFMLVFETEPLSPIDLALQETLVRDGDEGEVVETKFFLEECKQTLELAKKTLRRAQKCYKSR